ncbi:MAG: ABC transporter permease [Chloroflexota bacterium]|nr:ABC transporter permease [Chloroflexota bacterium]
MAEAARGRPMALGGFRGSAQRVLIAVLRFARANPAGAIGAVIVLAFLLAAVLADVVTPFTLDKVVARRLEGPLSTTFAGQRLWIGSDELGRDLLTRLLHGGRTSLLVGLAAPALGVTIALLLGVSSAYFGGLVDLLVQRLVDVLLTVPSLVLVMAVILSFGFSMETVIVAIALSHIGGPARVVRSQALSLREMQFVEAAKAIGASHWRIISRYLVPNTFAPVIVLIATGIGSAITTEATLSFLGLGIQPPQPSWGNMLSNAQRYFRMGPHIVLAPGLAIGLVVLAVNLFGDSLRDALDPRLRGRR